MRAAHPRILLAEHGRTETGVTLRSLCAEREHGLELLFVSKGSNLSLALRTYCPDIALLDLELFQPDPPAALSVLHRSAPTIPLILFASPADKGFAEQCLGVGAKEFMLEGCMDMGMLERMVRVAVRESGGKFAPETGTDPLTGLMNRDGLIAEAQRWRGLHLFSARRLLVSIRVQNLEAIQLYAGERETESLLRDVARLLQRKVRKTDLEAHVAPGHFVLLIQGVAAAGLPAVHRRISNSLSDFNETRSAAVKPLLAIHSEFLQ